MGFGKFGRRNNRSRKAGLFTSNHPEVDIFGLNANYSLWAEFNRELLVRKWVACYRDSWVYADHPTYEIPTEGIEVDCGNEHERDMADVAIQELIDFGCLDPVTFTKIERDKK